MKMQIALLAATLLMTGPVFAEGDCVFGQTTFDLEEKFEAPRGQHEFYKGETISLSKPVRLGGLYNHEKQLIGLAMQAEGDMTALEEQLKEFSMTDGYITYFSHAPTGRQFAQIAHFPGDNEYGVVVEIRVQPEGTEILGVVALIQDGAYTQAP